MTYRDTIGLILISLPDKCERHSDKQTHSVTNTRTTVITQLSHMLLHKTSDNPHFTIISI